MSKVITIVCNHCRREINDGHGHGIHFVGNASARAVGIKDAENHLCADCAKAYAKALIPLYPSITIQQTAEQKKRAIEMGFKASLVGNRCTSQDGTMVHASTDKIVTLAEYYAKSESERLRDALHALLDALAANDEDGLTEFADVMQAARAALRPL